MIPISLTCADYARVMPLATGEVKPEGIALTMILGSRGSWPARAEMLRVTLGRLAEGLEVVVDHAVQYGVLGVARLVVRSAAAHSRDIGSA